MKKLLYSVSLLMIAFLGGSVAYAQCEMLYGEGYIVREHGRMEFTVTQGVGSTAIGSPNGSWLVKCGPAGSDIDWFKNRSDGGTFQEKLDAILDGVNADPRKLTGGVWIYDHNVPNPSTAPPVQQMEFDFGRRDSIIDKDYQTTDHLGEGKWGIVFFGGSHIVGNKNIVTDISLGDKRPMFRLLNSTLPTITYAIDYRYDPMYPDPDECHVSYSMHVEPQGRIHLGNFSKSELDSNKEKTTDVRLITTRHMEGKNDACDAEINPNLYMTASTDLPYSGHEAKMENGTSAFIYNVIPRQNIMREWILDGTTGHEIGNFDFNNKNETILRFIWKKTAGETVKVGPAGGTIYLKTTIQ